MKRREENAHLVEFHNDLTNEKIIKMTSKEMDLFFSICYKLKNKSTEEINISFSELKMLSDYKTSNSIEELDKELNSIIDTMFFVMHIKQGSKTRHEPLFNYFETDLDTRTLTVSIKPQYEYLLNNLIEQFEKFELEEFTSLDSKYSKRLYKLLKQFRTTGVYTVSKEELYKNLDVPNTYRQCDINTRVLKPAVKECEKYIKNLKCETIPKNAKGKAIKGFLFSFTKEIDNKLQEQAKQNFKATRTREKKNKFNDMELQSETYSNITIDEYEQAILSN